MTWERIPGWVDESLRAEYDDAIARAPSSGAIFVEVGAAFGKSTAYMASQIAKSGKRIKFVTIDPWIETDWILRDCGEIIQSAGGFRQAFERYMREEAAEERERVETFQSTAVEVARMWPAVPVDFVFLDGDHSREAVAADIAAWLPHLRSGGVIAGHDHSGSHPGVEPACVEAFGAGGYQIRGVTWRWRKP